MSKEIPWRRVLVEGVVIVGSILLALGLEAWWAEEGQRREEREALSRVHDELVLNRDRIMAIERVHGLAASASLNLVELIDELDADSGSIYASDRELYSLLAAPEFETETPTLDGLLRSGGVEIISDADVRGAVANWEATLRDASSSETEAKQFVSTLLLPDLVGRGDISHILLQSRGGIVRLDIDGVTSIRADSKLKALIAHRHATAATIGRNLERVRAALDSVVTMTRRDNER
jgi:hypothetical protein